MPREGELPPAQHGRDFTLLSMQLLLPSLPGIGKEINGSRVWIGIGSLQFQPAELGKVAMVLFLASYLTTKRELLQEARVRIGPFHVPELKHLGPVLVAWGVSLAILFLEKDLGASLLYFGIFVVMLWVATGRGAYLAIGAGLFVIGALIAYATFGRSTIQALRSSPAAAAFAPWLAACFTAATAWSASPTSLPRRPTPSPCGVR